MIGDEEWWRTRWKVTRILAYNSISPLGPNPEVCAQNGWHIKDNEFLSLYFNKNFLPLVFYHHNHYHYDQQGDWGQAQSCMMTGRGRGGKGRRRDVEGIGGSTGRGGRTASTARTSMDSGDELSYVLHTFSSIFALFSLWTKAFTCHHYKHCFSCAVRTRILPLHPPAVTRMSRIRRAVTPCDIHHHTWTI